MPFVLRPMVSDLEPLFELTHGFSGRNGLLSQVGTWTAVEREIAVPACDTAKETETYLFGGRKLVARDPSTRHRQGQRIPELLGGGDFTEKEGKTMRAKSIFRLLAVGSFVFYATPPVQSHEAGKYVIQLLGPAVSIGGPSEEKNLEGTLYSAFAKIKACAEVPGLGAALFGQVQDPGDITSLNVNVGADNDKSATVTVQIQSISGKTKQKSMSTVQLRKIGTDWKVYDICWPPSSKCYRAQVANWKC